MSTLPRTTPSTMEQLQDEDDNTIFLHRLWGERDDTPSFINGILDVDDIPRPLTDAERDSIRQGIRSHPLPLQAVNLKLPQDHKPAVSALMDVLRGWKLFRVNDLPTEILCSIFGFAVVSELEDTNGQNTNARDWTSRSSLRCELMLVCRRWRDAVVGDAFQWNDITVTPRRVEASLIWLERSKNAPLTVRLDDLGTDGFQEATIRRAVVFLTLWLPQIRSLYLRIYDPLALCIALDWLYEFNTCGEATGLQHFHIVAAVYLPFDPSRSEQVQDIAECRIPVPGFHNLRVLDLYGVILLGVDLTRWDLTSLSLSRVDCTYLGEHWFPTFLDHCHNLESLRLVLIKTKTRTHPPLTGVVPFKLHRLRELRIGEMSLRYSHYLLKWIECPHITSLSIFYLSGECSPLLETLAPMCKDVTSLFLHGLYFESQDTPGSPLLSMLRAMKHLSSLSLKDCRSSTSVLSVLLTSLDDTVRLENSGNRSHVQQSILSCDEDWMKHILCPNLVFLKCSTQFDSEDLGLQTLVDFLRGRKALGYPLSRVVLFPELASEQTEMLVDTARSLSLTLDMIDDAESEKVFFEVHKILQTDEWRTERRPITLL